METYQYKVAWCPVCNQGWAEIVKEITSKKLFVSCGECEAEWEHPEDVPLRNKGTRFKYGQVGQPSEEDVKSVGWDRYII